MTNNLGRYAAPVGRWLISLVFAVSVLKKIATPSATIAMLGDLGLPAPALFYGLAVAGELGGTLSLVFGWRQQLGAAILIGFTVLATFLVHFHPADPQQMVHVFKNFAIIGGLLQIIAFGGKALAPKATAR